MSRPWTPCVGCTGGRRPRRVPLARPPCCSPARRKAPPWRPPRSCANWDVGVELWSATSYKALRDEALGVERWNRLHPRQEPLAPLVAELLGESGLGGAQQSADSPIVAVSDFMKIVPEQIARFVPGRLFVPLGTDGMGRSDTREALRRHFETDTGHVVVGVLSALAAGGSVDVADVDKAIAHYGIDPDLPDPRDL